MTRRSFAVAGAALLCKGATSPPIRLYIGTYGMQAMEVDRALELIRATGYDGAELCCLPGWPSEPSRLDAPARRRIRESGLPVPTLLESFDLQASGEAARAVPGRIRAAAALAHDVKTSATPLVQTVLGGKPGNWDQVKDAMAIRLEEWARVAQDNGIRLAVKAHVMQTVDTPGRLLWLLGKVDHPALTAIYDYGHFQPAGIGIEESMDALLPRSAFLTLKDAAAGPGATKFLLPGDGAIDYTRYFRKVHSMGWQGWALVEVSRSLQTQPGYDPAVAARRSYENLAPVLDKLGMRRTPLSKASTKG